jgi:hypothetical protein
MDTLQIVVMTSNLYRESDEALTFLNSGKLFSVIVQAYEMARGISYCMLLHNETLAAKHGPCPHGMTGLRNPSINGRSLRIY